MLKGEKKKERKKEKGSYEILMSRGSKYWYINTCTRYGKNTLKCLVFALYGRCTFRRQKLLSLSETGFVFPSSFLI